MNYLLLIFEIIKSLIQKKAVHDYDYDYDSCSITGQKTIDYK